MSNVRYKPHIVLHLKEHDGTEHHLIILELHSLHATNAGPAYYAVTLEDVHSTLLMLGSSLRFGKATMARLARISPSAAALEWCAARDIEANFVYATGGPVGGDRPTPEILTKGESRSWVPQWEERLPEMLAKGEVVAQCTCTRDHFEPHAEGCPERLWNERRAEARKSVPGAEMIGIVPMPPGEYDEP
jgi:hypothetical protein